MFRKFAILLTMISTFLACSVNEKPKFIGVENIKVLKTSGDFITLSADALFVNPNDIGGYLKTDAMKVYVNDNEMTSISTKNFEVPAKDEFFIPLKADIALDSIVNGKNIGDVLGSILSKKIKVQYKGDIKYNVAGFTYTYSIDKTENLKIKF